MTRSAGSNQWESVYPSMIVSSYSHLTASCAPGTYIYAPNPHASRLYLGTSPTLLVHISVELGPQWRRHGAAAQNHTPFMASSPSPRPNLASTLSWSTCLRCRTCIFLSTAPCSIEALARHNQISNLESPSLNRRHLGTLVLPIYRHRPHCPCSTTIIGFSISRCKITVIVN